ncbi:amino acid transporter [Dactylonectria estremocensis]|uniref:Amino acid transporter n=1 Tax=Dactylonectria estremocensis TaxID=1079267 RepID=A0A9P9DTL9_9HYPO|nr:amino acid transporter [Dactylonectria estremocensis]
MDHAINTTLRGNDAAGKEKMDDAIAPHVSDNVMVGEVLNENGHTDAEKQKMQEGDAHFHRLGWKRLAVVLIVESIALGCLSLPSAFATLGMVAGVVLCIGLGLIAIYACYVLGKVSLKFPGVAHYADIGRLMWGKFGYYLFSAIFISQLTLVVGSHCLTGKIAFNNITQSDVCSIVFGAVSAIILLLLAIPPSFAEIAVLGYVDCASIGLAILITIIATGVQGAQAPGGLSAVTWSAWPKEDLSFSEAFIAVNNIVFAYAFAGAQPSFMQEMHTPKDFIKSTWAVMIVQIAIYTLTGAIIYAFVGQDVQSPALLSAGPVISRVVFGIALPVIFISGSINTTVVCRYIHGNLYKDSVVRYVNTKKGWVTWLGLVSIITLFAWIIAEAVPIFSELLSISASLFVSGLSFYFPPLMWFFLLKEGKWYSKENIKSAVCNGIVFLVGIIVLVAGTYSTVVELINKFASGTINKPFSC